MNWKTLPSSIHPGWMLLALWMFTSAVAADESPDDAYLEAYLTMQDAARLEQRGDLRGAVDKLATARQQFLRVQADWPDWNPQMVGYRLEKVDGSLGALRDQVGGSGGGEEPALGRFTRPRPVESATTRDLSPAPVESVGPTSSGDPFTEIRQRMQSLEEENRKFRQENERLSAELGRKEAAYGEVLDRVTQARQRELNLSDEVAALEQRLETATDGNVDELLEIREQLVEYRQQFTAAQEAADQAEARATKLAGELDETRGAMEAFRERAENLEEEDFPTRLADLTSQNERLRRDLETARSRIGVLEEEAEEKDLQIAQLQQNLKDIRQQLALLKQENVRYQAEVAELTSELREARDRIAALPEETAVDEELAEENRLLRGVIMRQLRAQARQQQAKALIIEELENMDQVSNNLLSYVNDLTSTRVVLTEEEKALFQDPQLQELFSGDDTVATVMSQAGDQPGDGEPNTSSGSSEARGDDEQVGEEVSEEVSDENRPALVDLLKKARSSAAEKDYEAAEAAYEDFLRADPRNSDVLCNLGVVKINLDELEEAEVSLMRALEFADGKHPGAHFYLGVSHFRRNQLNDAFASIEESLRQDPTNAQARHFLGVTASRLGLSDRAQAEFKSAIAIRPDYAAAHFNLAVLFATAEPPDYAAARTHYLEAVNKGAGRDEKMERLLAEHVNIDTVAN